MTLFEVVNGEAIPVALAKDCTLTATQDVVEMASISSRAKAFAAGRYQWTLSATYLYSVGLGNTSYNQQLRALLALTEGKALAFRFTEARAYDGNLHEVSLPAIEYSGEVLVTSYAINAPVEGYASLEISFQGTGDLTIKELDIVDGGTATTVHLDTIDGGESATTYTNTLEGGKSV
jgi:hypothetical protein